MKKILFVTSEAHPLVKTGGLADVSGSLPKSLAELGEDIRLIMPYYHAVRTDVPIYYKSTIRIIETDVNILETRLPGTDVIVWLLDYPRFFKLPGGPYQDAGGNPWPDSAERFALFCRLAVEIAMNRAYLGWQPDIIHCNDWQSGLVPALLSLEAHPPKTLFTIHNLAYQGLFPKAVNFALALPEPLWNSGNTEFHGMLSFLKSGLAYADRINTVSPTYAMEIQGANFGCGLEGLLSHRQDVLTGILNGVDTGQWNPKTDPALAANYDTAALDKKPANKAALQQRLGLPNNKKIPLFGLISRLVEQKGIDLLLECLPELMDLPLQLVVLGSGNKAYEQQLTEFAAAYPKKMAVTVGYDENLSHWIEAGADVFLMPSRYEPCGLNQMYSQLYGTLPIVNKTGGLADTVVDTAPQTLADHTATGIVINNPLPGALLEAIKRALILFEQPEIWRQVQQNAMNKDFSWQHSAKEYQALYEMM